MPQRAVGGAFGQGLCCVAVSTLLRVTLLALFALLGLAPGRAWAQACCAGGGAYLPAKLMLHEDALVGVQLRAAGGLGSLDAQGHDAATPSGDQDLEFAQTLAAGIRVLGRGQLGLSVPFNEARRVAGGLADLGGGVGDVALAFRYDFVTAGESAHVPGLALTVGITAPTGRAPESAHSPLLTDSTGTGAWQGQLGGEVEQTFGNAVLSLLVTLSARAPRTVGEVREQLGPQLAGFAAAGYMFPHAFTLALVASTSQSLNASINGETVPHSGRGLTTLSLAAGYPLSDTWRLQAALNADLPVLGRSNPVGLGGTFTVVRAWL